jgi:two-component system NtrC family sensor kinase
MALLQAFADQAALALDNARLYEEARARLRELQETQTQLVQAAKLSAVGQLVSGVAHELNNPLSVVVGHSQLMLSRGVPPEVKRPVELILAQGDRMTKIVQGLLLFSRQRPPSRGPVDLAKIIQQILDIRGAQFRVSGIRVEVEHAELGVKIIGDSHQLQQVFLNLMLNAEQAILGSGVGDAIRVQTQTRSEGDRTWVVIDVIDNGPGIPPDVLPHVFNPFFTTKPVGQGTGLGLSVSYGIVQQHGGRVTVDSQPGRTVFTVELPVTEPAAAAPRTPAIETPRSVGTGRQALVVEDEPAIAELMSTLLRQTGWRVDVAPGGRQALDRVRDTAYDLIVSDMRMPDGSGEEFYRAVTSERSELAERFVWVTGDTANPGSWTFLEKTRSPVLEKPFNSDELLRVVERLVAERVAPSPNGGA